MSRQRAPEPPSWLIGLQLDADDGSESAAIRARSLDLRGEHVSADDLAFLIPVLQDHPNVQTLDLSGQGFGQPGAIALAALLDQVGTIQSLECHTNGFGSTGIRTIARVLQGNDVLKSLNVSRNSMGREGFHHLFTSLLDKSSLKNLDAGLNLIDHLDGELLEEVLASSCLERLLLSQNRLRGAATCRAIASALSANPSGALKHLDLRGNPLQNDGVSLIFDALWSNTTLVYLNVSDCHFDQGSFVAMALRQNATLKELHMTKNALAGSEVEIIIEAIEVGNGTLEVAELPPATFEENQLKVALARNKSGFGPVSTPLGFTKSALKR